jgi:hypothetical protein
MVYDQDQQYNYILTVALGRSTSQNFVRARNEYSGIDAKAG